MSFAHPLWFILMAPWVGLVILCLREYRPRIYVPFLRLWPREEARPSNRQYWRPPAAAVVLLLLAILASVLAFTGPSLRSANPSLRHLSIVVDRGVTMLAAGRLQQSARDALAATEGLLPADATIRVRDVYVTRIASPATVYEAASAGATALDEQHQLPAIAQQEARRGPVLLLSDLPDPPNNVIACPPAGTPQNVGIVSAAPAHGKLLLVLRNDSDRTAARIETRCAGGRSDTRSLGLPARGNQQRYTFDVPGEPTSLRLLDADDLDDDNIRWIVPSPSARLLTSAGLSPRAQRFAESYAQARRDLPATGEVRITTAAEAPSQNAIIVPPAGRRMTIDASVCPDHPVLANVRLPSAVLAGAAPAARLAKGEPWRALLSAGGQPLLAIDEGNRRAFIAFEPAAEEDVPEWVILMTNITDYLARPRVSTSAPRRLPAGWNRVDPGPTNDEPGTRYGVYSRGDELIAVNVPSPSLRVCQPVNIRERLMQLAVEQSRWNLAPWIWAAATMLAGAAVATATVQHKAGLTAGESLRRSAAV